MSTDGSTARPPVSAVFATIRGWPAAREAMSHIGPQLAAVSGEMVVADGSDEPAPTPGELAEIGPNIKWMSLPGKSVLQLRSEAYKAASGEIVAITEDHVFVAPDWIERILEAHREYPNAGAVGGAVLNNTNEKIVDWAVFFLTQGPFMPPLQNGVVNRISGPANVSYKKRVIDRLHSDPAVGIIDWLELPAALAGEDLVADDRIRAWHNQSMGVVGTSVVEFHNGRSIAGYRRRAMTTGDWLRIATAPILPTYRAIRQMRIVRKKQMPPGMTTTRFAATLPMHMWLQYVAIVGELVGYATGPGDSPRRLN